MYWRTPKDDFDQLASDKPFTDTEHIRYLQHHVWGLDLELEILRDRVWILIGLNLICCVMFGIILWGGQ